jgi:hypothetical protein
VAHLLAGGRGRRGRRGGGPPSACLLGIRHGRACHGPRSMARSCSCGRPGTPLDSAGEQRRRRLAHLEQRRWVAAESGSRSIGTREPAGMNVTNRSRDRVGLGILVRWISKFGRLGSFLWRRSAKRPFMRAEWLATIRFLRELMR